MIPYIELWKLPSYSLKGFDWSRGERCSEPGGIRTRETAAANPAAYPCTGALDHSATGSEHGAILSRAIHQAHQKEHP